MLSKPTQLLFVAVLWLAALVVPPTTARGEDEKPDAGAAKEKAPASDPTDFDIPVPEGQPVRGIKIPYYAADGTTLQMTVAADVARRIDEEHVEMDNMRIDAVSDEGNDILVEMPHAVFNMEDRMLSGNKGVLIEREDFEIRGREGEFDIRTRFGKVIGNVKMIIKESEPLE